MKYKYEYEVGDKVICIKSIVSNNLKVFTLGKQYIINYVFIGNGVDIFDDDGDDWGFDFEGDGFDSILSEHFVTLKESRKLKLNELDKIKNR